MNNHNPDHDDYEDFDDISADRLCQAAEAILHAVATLAEDGIARPAPEILGSPVQPACLSDFTRAEVVEAAAFLHRLGVLTDD
jgi:hypothetical protein